MTHERSLAAQACSRVTKGGCMLVQRLHKDGLELTTPTTTGPTPSLGRSGADYTNYHWSNAITRTVWSWLDQLPLVQRCQSQRGNSKSSPFHNDSLTIGSNQNKALSRLKNREGVFSDSGRKIISKERGSIAKGSASYHHFGHSCILRWNSSWWAVRD